MTWIKIIEEEEADEDLREAYREAGAARGRVAHILKAHSLNPAAMRAHLALYRELMFGRSELARAERELIAVAVSVSNHCHY
ncbi:MAG: carboxymuconolactone decarboxylase family protein [Acidobacteria bacterium]|nr:carboxymuconolactone decarboxylase family protein [Acidobacteriota bacterium]